MSCTLSNGYQDDEFRFQDRKQKTVSDLLNWPRFTASFFDPMALFTAFVIEESYR